MTTATDKAFLESEIVRRLKAFGWQTTTALTYAFGSDFSAAIKSLHAQGRVEKTSRGWTAK